MAERKQSGWTRRDVLALVVLCLLVEISYLPAVGADFVWDDYIIIARARAVQEWSGLFRIWFSPGEIEGELHYWPIVYTSFWLEHKLWGFAPGPYHVVNILLHMVNTVLLWRLMRRLRVYGAWLIAAVFAAHPLHVDSVAWVIARKDLLSALFYLTAFGAYVRYVEAPRPGRWLPVLALYVAGMLSKSIVVTLPAALVIWRWWDRGRVIRQDLLPLLPLFAAGLAIAIGDLAFTASRDGYALDLSIVERIQVAGRALWFYVGKLLWPFHLAVVYPHWDVDAADPLAWGYAAAAVAAAALLWSLRHGVGRGPLAGAAFFAVTLSPVLGIIPFGFMNISFVAERYQYLAGIGLMAVLVSAAARAADRLPRGFRAGAWGLAAAVVALLAVLTWRHAGHYRDDVTLFSHVQSLNPGWRDVHLQLSYAMFRAGRMEEALAHGRSAAQWKPDSPDGHNNVGAALVELGRHAEAEPHLRRALEIDPDHRDAHVNLGALFLALDRLDEAERHLSRALEIDPHHPGGLRGRAELRHRRGGDGEG